MTKQANTDKPKGEGDHDAARRYNESGREFVETGKADKAPDPAGQPQESSEWAEREGKSRAKELDPQVHRDYGKATDK